MAEGVWWGVACVAWMILSCPALAQREPYPVDSARVEIHTWRDSSRVTTRVWFARPVRALDFTYLSNTCTQVNDLVFQRAGAPASLAADTTPPWIVLHDTTEVANGLAAAMLYELSYHVTHASGAHVAIPVVQPAGPLSTRSAAVLSKVRLTVTGELPLVGDPTFPRFSAVGLRQWEAAMVAVPSHVVLRSGEGANATRCEPPNERRGESGGFLRLVALLVTTIVLWIPLYFWWATRRRAGDDEGAS